MGTGGAGIGWDFMGVDTHMSPLGVAGFPNLCYPRLPSICPCPVDQNITPFQSDPSSPDLR